MFVSAEHLNRYYGIDSKIARFFVDREPPVDNAYWHDKLLYLRPATGYLFIPLAIDLWCRAGIDREQLLSEEFVTVFEKITHFGTLEEMKKLTNDEAIEKSLEFVKARSKNEDWLKSVKNYFDSVPGNVLGSLATPFKSLHRGDLFLLPLSVIQFPLSLTEKITEMWFALITILLIFDDAEDLQADTETGDENAYLESGLNPEGVERVMEILRQSFQKIHSVNPVMYDGLYKDFQERMERPYIHPLIKTLQ